MRTMRGLHAVAMLCVAGAILLVAFAAQACDTPVYEYTLRYWDRDPYVVLHFHRGSDATGDAAVNERLTKMSRSNANIWFQSVDVDAFTDETAKSLAQQVWQQHSEDEPPLYVVLSPRRAEVFSGQLDLASIETIARSPKRTEMNKQLCEGKQGVLVLLKGPLADENARAEQVVRATLATAAQEEHQVGFVIVQRDDPKEEWFVRQLLALEPDLKDLDNAMIFSVFGRGHALEPYLGKGITERNLAEVIWFMNGPCSCEIKMAAPGVDLVTDWNWQAHIAELPFLEEAPVEFQLFDVEEAPTQIVTETAEPEPAADADVNDGDAPVSELAADGDGPGEHADAPEEASTVVKPSEPDEEKPEPVEATAVAEEPADPQPQTEPETLVEEDESASPAPAEEAPIQVAEAVRTAPYLPPTRPPASADDAEAEQPESVASSMGSTLGYVLGGLGVLVLVVSVVIVRARKES